MLSKRHPALRPTGATFYYFLLLIPHLNIYKSLVLETFIIPVFEKNILTIIHLKRKHGEFRYTIPGGWN